MTDGTGNGLISFFDYAVEKGLMNRNSAWALRNASSKVLSVEDNWQTLDVASIDVDELCTRFEHRCGGDFTPKTLATYRRRFHNAVSLYLEYIKNPSGWKAPKSHQRVSKRPGPAAQAVNESPASSTEQPRNASAVGVAIEGIVHRFPLRADCDAQLTLPRDLSTEEARRLAVFISALAIDPPPQTGA